MQNFLLGLLTGGGIASVVWFIVLRGLDEEARWERTKHESS